MMQRALTCFLALSCCAFAQDLGLFEKESDVGTVLHPGSVQYDAASHTYTVTGSGENMWAATDAFHFVWKKVTGDVTLTADVTFLGAGGEAHRKGVLMIRQSLDASSPYVDAALHGNGLTSIQARDEKGAMTHEVQSYMSAPHRARIEKRGRFVYVFAAGEDGTLHPSGGAMQFDFDGPFYVGLGVCAHNKDAVAKVEFSNVDLKTGPQSGGKPSLYSTLEVVRLAALTDHRAVTVAPGRIESPTWTSDGSAIVYSLDGAIQRIAADGGKPESLVMRPAPPSSDPVDKFIYFSSDRSGTAQVWRTKPDGANPERVTTDESNDYFPHISPDGEHLAYLSYDKDVKGYPQDREVTLRILNLTTSKIEAAGRFLGGERSMDAPIWSPDSRRIAFVSYQSIPNPN